MAVYVASSPWNAHEILLLLKAILYLIHRQMTIPGWLNQIDLHVLIGRFQKSETTGLSWQHP